MYSAKILGYQFDTVFGLYLPEYVIPSPVVQTDYRQIPGMDGAIDKTEQFGAVRYKTRTWKLQFQKTGKNISSDDLFDLEQDLLNKVHGLSGQIIFDDDPDFYWKGRAFVENVSCKNNGLLIADIELITDPYKYSFDNIVVSGDVVSETETYSGTVVIFDASAADSISNISVAISPIQDLNGYDHPWPAGGGKNLLPAITQTKTQSGVTFTVNADGTLTVNGTATARAYVYLITYTEFLPNGEYTISVSGVPSTQGVSSSFVNLTYSDNGTTYSGTYGTLTGNGTKTYTVSHQYSSVLFDVPAGNVFNNNVIKVQIESGTTATSWAPYSNICPISGRTGLSVYVSPTQDPDDATVYNVDWSTQAGTVYGGTLDVVTGVLTVDKVLCTYTGNETVSSRSGIYIPVKLGASGIYVTNDVICTDFEYVRVSANGWSYIQTTMTPAEVQTYLQNHTVSIVCELATPITYQLTHQEVEALLGTNNIWADAGDVTVTVQSMYVFNLQNNRKPIVPTVTNTENVQLVFTIQGVTYTKSLVPGNRKIVELVLFSGTTNVYAKGSGVVTFEYEDAQL